MYRLSKLVEKTESIDIQPEPYVVSPLVAICIDYVLKHRLVDDHKLLEANSQEHSLCLRIGTTYSDLPMEIQHQVMERAAELCLLDDFWIGYFIPGINELGALNARGCGLTDAGVELLVGGCPSLLSLDLSFCTSISGAAFARLVGMSNLNKSYSDGYHRLLTFQIQDLNELADLSVEGTKITNESLSALSRMFSTAAWSHFPECIYFFYFIQFFYFSILSICWIQIMI